MKRHDPPRVNVQTRVPKPLMKEIDDAIEGTILTRSDVIRQGIDLWLEAFKKDPKRALVNRSA